jgi:hypothetical protein
MLDNWNQFEKAQLPLIRDICRRAALAWTNTQCLPQLRVKQYSFAGASAILGYT